MRIVPPLVDGKYLDILGVFINLFHCCNALYHLIISELLILTCIPEIHNNNNN